MSLKNDLKYPFGNPLDTMFNERLLVALTNTLNLAKERVWLAEGRPAGLQNADYSDFLDQADIPHAKNSFDVVEKMLVEVQKSVYDQE